MNRLQTLGLFVTLLAVAVLVGSLVAGLDRPATPTPRPQPAAEPLPRVRAEVLNAAGTPGLAREATRLLRDRNVDVVFFGNAQSFGRDSSVVIDRSGRLEAARRVADLLEIRHVRSEPDSNLYLDATVVIGRDWSRGAKIP